MNPELITRIMNSLLDIIPEGWNEIKIRLNVNDGFFEMFFYVKVNEQWIYCFDLPNLYDVSLDEIDELFDELGDMFFEEQSTKWTSATIMCLNTGKFKVTYEYDERISFEEWKVKNIS